MHGIAPEDLGVKGCLLIYRRRGQDMPLAQPPVNATLDQIAKTEAIRQKMLHLAQEKYLFRFQDRRVSTGLLIEDGRLVGLKLAETKVEGRKAEPLYEGGDAKSMLARVAAIRQSGVNLIVLLALSDSGHPAYEVKHAEAIASLGCPVFACTPDQFPSMMASALTGKDLMSWAAEEDIALIRGS